MCVLIVPKSMLKKDKYPQEFEDFWSHQALDRKALIESEKEQDKAFLEMVKATPIK